MFEFSQWVKIYAFNTFFHIFKLYIQQTSSCKVTISIAEFSSIGCNQFYAYISLKKNRKRSKFTYFLRQKKYIVKISPVIHLWIFRHYLLLHESSFEIVMSWLSIFPFVQSTVFKYIDIGIFPNLDDRTEWDLKESFKKDSM